MSDHDLEQAYNEFLDEVYGPISICGLEYAASYALKQVDPTAYRVGFADWSADLENNEVES